MCGGFYLQQSPRLREYFGIQSREDLAEFTAGRAETDPWWYFEAAAEGERRVFRPTDTVPFLARARDGRWVLKSGTWWLAMDEDEDGWRPNQRLVSFNSRIDKVTGSGPSIHQRPPRSFRVVIPATAFVEWHEKVPHLFRHPEGQPLALGGMAKAYPLEDPSGGANADGHHYAVSIVTLPGHPATRHIHEKSVPLMLDREGMAAWLDRGRPHSDFTHLLAPTLPHALSIQAVQDLKTMQPLAEAEQVKAG
ncbi:SOS response-associated peptidase family protein [Natronospira bacteriovora]|uniref:Abasic site processing protein n=1 Tax=Natronospira bacteriovora TaxID=3069753 RepID=A0ABU0W4A4_9GAMM|nr:SOS response-associated peptidase family protein [Natronospira sp. AB-CW4]MDQ2068789.1 SOS response-associated peptidase family protein [Natronospira sp. AB-CW4]